MKIKNKITPKIIKELSKHPEDEQDYALLYLFTENDYDSYDKAKAVYEEMDIQEFTTTVAEVMKVFTDKISKLNTLSLKLNDQ